MEIHLQPVSPGDLCHPTPKWPSNHPNTKHIEQTQRCIKRARRGYERYFFKWTPLQSSDRAEWPFTYQWEASVGGRVVAYGSQGQTRTPAISLKQGDIVLLNLRVKDRTGQLVGHYSWHARVV